MEKQTSSRYSLSFTSGALLMQEALSATPIYTEVQDWSLVREALESGNLLQARTHSSSVRRAREVCHRLAFLSDQEISYFLDTTATERRYLLWIAACRRYPFIGEFAEEVLRERFIVMAGTVNHGDFDSFLRSRALWHEEVANLKESTAKKIRSNIFRMLMDTGMLEADGRIVSPVLTRSFMELLDSRTPSDLRFFPVIVGIMNSKAG